MLLQLSHQSAIKQKYSSSSATDLSDNNLPNEGTKSSTPEDFSKQEDSDTGDAVTKTAFRSYKGKRTTLSLPCHQPLNSLYSTSASEAEEIPRPRPLLLSKNLSTSKTSLHSQVSMDTLHQNDYANASNGNNNSSTVASNSALRRSRTRASVASTRSSASDKTLTNSTENLLTGEMKRNKQVNRPVADVIDDNSNGMASFPSEFHIRGAEVWNIAAEIPGENTLKSKTNETEIDNSSNRDSSLVAHSYCEKIKDMGNIAEKVLEDTHKERKALELLHALPAQAFKSNNKSKNEATQMEVTTRASAVASVRKTTDVAPKVNRTNSNRSHEDSSDKKIVDTSRVIVITGRQRKPSTDSINSNNQQFVDNTTQPSLIQPGNGVILPKKASILNSHHKENVSTSYVLSPSPSHSGEISTGTVSANKTTGNRETYSLQASTATSVNEVIEYNENNTNKMSTANAQAPHKRSPSTNNNQPTAMMSSLIKSPGQKGKPKSVKFHDVIDTISLSASSDISTMDSISIESKNNNYSNNHPVKKDISRRLSFDEAVTGANSLAEAVPSANILADVEVEPNAPTNFSNVSSLAPASPKDKQRSASVDSRIQHRNDTKDHVTDADDSIVSAQDLRRKSLQLFQNIQISNARSSRSPKPINGLGKQGDSPFRRADSPFRVMHPTSANFLTKQKELQQLPLQQQPTLQLQQQLRQIEDQDAIAHNTDSDYVSNSSECGNAGQKQQSEQMTAPKPWYQSDSDSLCSYTEQSPNDSSTAVRYKQPIGLANGHDTANATANHRIHPKRHEVLKKGLQISEC